MRDIVFRGKRTSDGKWIAGHSITQFDVGEGLFVYISEKDSVLYCEVDPETVGQNTGLRDKNGMPIFEGDILRMDNFTPAVCDVRFIEGAFCLMFMGAVFSTDIHYVQHAGKLSSTIIGNIYDNPELLERGMKSAGDTADH